MWRAYSGSRPCTRRRFGERVVRRMNVSMKRVRSALRLRRPRSSNSASFLAMLCRSHRDTVRDTRQRARQFRFALSADHRASCITDHVIVTSYSAICDYNHMVCCSPNVGHAAEAIYTTRARVPPRAKDNQTERADMPAPMIAGLTSAEQAVFAALLEAHRNQSTKNGCSTPTDGHRVFEDLGISDAANNARPRRPRLAMKPCPPRTQSTSSRAPRRSWRSITRTPGPGTRSTSNSCRPSGQLQRRLRCIVVGAGDTSRTPRLPKPRTRVGRLSVVTRRRYVTAGLAINSDGHATTQTGGIRFPIRRRSHPNQTRRCSLPVKRRSAEARGCGVAITASSRRTRPH